MKSDRETAEVLNYWTFFIVQNPAISRYSNDQSLVSNTNDTTS